MNPRAIPEITHNITITSSGHDTNSKNRYARDAEKNKFCTHFEEEKNSPEMLFALEWIRLRCAHFAIGDSVCVDPPTALLSSNNLCSNCKIKSN